MRITDRYKGVRMTEMMLVKKLELFSRKRVYDEIEKLGDMDERVVKRRRVSKNRKLNASVRYVVSK